MIKCREAGDHSYGRKAYMAYVTEGLGNLLEWDEIMMFQRKNGSFFNCPSTTAATLVNHYNDKALQYLNCLVSKFGSAGESARIFLSRTFYSVNCS